MRTQLSLQMKNFNSNSKPARFPGAGLTYFHLDLVGIGAIKRYPTCTSLASINQN
jgi:hypothetical protein